MSFAFELYGSIRKRVVENGDHHLFSRCPKINYEEKSKSWPDHDGPVLGPGKEMILVSSGQELPVWTVWDWMPRRYFTIPGKQ